MTSELVQIGTPKRLARVFPRITKATPQDELSFFGPPPRLFPPDADEIHVDCTFTADKPKAEWLADQWHSIGIPVKIGGVAYGDSGGDFVPGRYIRHGYTFTSRGCPRRCWFCSVWKRDPTPRLLPIKDSKIIQAEAQIEVMERQAGVASDFSLNGKEWKERALKAEKQLEALSRPVSPDEYFNRAIIGGDNSAVAIFNRILAARKDTK